MYPPVCAGNFFLPMKTGRYSITGFSAVVNNTAAASRITLVDDPSIKPSDPFGKLLSLDYDTRTGIIDVKGLANSDGVLEQLFVSSVKIRHGISIVNSLNLVAGTLKLYVE